MTIMVDGIENLLLPFFWKTTNSGLIQSKRLYRETIPIFRTRVPFCSEKVASTEMCVSVMLYNICTLSTLTTAGATYSIYTEQKAQSSNRKD